LSRYIFIASIAIVYPNLICWYQYSRNAEQNLPGISQNHPNHLQHQPARLPNLKLTSERHKHNQILHETPPPKEDRPITPERSESGAADVRRLPV
jgi:hypothetical protein